MDASGTQTSGGISMSVKMASSVFMQPVSPNKRVIFMQGHNTSSATNLSFKPSLMTQLQQSGYKLTDDPNRAQFMLLYNVRYVGRETKDRTMEGALAGGYGGAVAGALASGVGTEHAAANTATGALVGSLVGAGIGYLMKTDKYMMVVDIQLEQRQKGAVTSTQTGTSEGLGNVTQSSSAAVHGWQIYRDRIAAEASGRRLAFALAEPALTKTVTHELAGIF